MPRKAVVAGIKDEVFSIYNSNSTSLKKECMMWLMLRASEFIKTMRKPVLKYGQQKKLMVYRDNRGKPDKKVVVAVNKKYARLATGLL